MELPPPLPKKMRVRHPLWVKALIALAVFQIVALVGLRMAWLACPLIQQSTAMAPAIEKGDGIIMEALTHRGRVPQRGDILVFATGGIKGLGHDIFIKRLVGLPGEELRLDHNGLSVNGVHVSLRNKAGEIAYSSVFTPKYLQNEHEIFTVPPGSYFVIGDNVLHSLDSRVWGSIPAKSVLGRAVWCYWPLEHQGRLE
jgi:signal peptidase I